MSYLQINRCQLTMSLVPDSGLGPSKQSANQAQAATKFAEFCSLTERLAIVSISRHKKNHAQMTWRSLLGQAKVLWPRSGIVVT